MRGPFNPRVVGWFITLLVCVFLFAVTALILTGVAYLVALVIVNMRAW